MTRLGAKIGGAAALARGTGKYNGHAAYRPPTPWPDLPEPAAREHCNSCSWAWFAEPWCRLRLKYVNRACPIHGQRLS